MYGYLINHFGDNPKYLEYELYFLINLRKLTNYDIIYLYSIHDTPKIYIEIIKSLKLNILFQKYDDNNVTINVKKFKSKYKHFNTLRTCNFIFSYLLTKYDKLCILESDMFLLKSIDDIFSLQCPSVFHTMNKDNIQLNNINYKLNFDLDNMINNCVQGSPINGGLLLIKPSIEKFKLCKKKIEEVIKNNCAFPNETLFLICDTECYNLPIKYNFLHYNFNNFHKYNDIRLIHYNNTIYKPIDIIKDNYIEKLKNTHNKEIIKKYKKSIYFPYIDSINYTLKKIDSHSKFN